MRTKLQLIMKKKNISRIQHALTPRQLFSLGIQCITINLNNMTHDDVLTSHSIVSVPDTISVFFFLKKCWRRWECRSVQTYAFQIDLEIYIANQFSQKCTAHVHLTIIWYFVYYDKSAYILIDTSLNCDKWIAFPLHVDWLKNQCRSICKFCACLHRFKEKLFCILYSMGTAPLSTS
jgi:hypothetical protein